MNWIRVLMVVLIILTIGTFVLSADMMAVARGGGSAFCKNYCQAHRGEHGGMGSCMKWCKYYYFQPVKTP